MTIKYKDLLGSWFESMNCKKQILRQMVKVYYAWSWLMWFSVHQVSVWLGNYCEFLVW